MCSEFLYDFKESICAPGILEVANMCLYLSLQIGTLFIIKIGCNCKKKSFIATMLINYFKTSVQGYKNKWYEVLPFSLAKDKECFKANIVFKPIQC